MRRLLCPADGQISAFRGSRYWGRARLRPAGNRLFPLALIFIICSIPEAPWAARLELRQAESQATELAVSVGDEIEIALWVSSDAQQLSGAAIFLSFDESVFTPIRANGEAIAAGHPPFASGDFLGNGEIFRNDLLASGDPAASAPGAQLDYSVVRAADNGAGTVASLRVRAIAPSPSATIGIDESGIRETRIFLPDGSQQAFRFITPMRVAVRGISIEGLPASLVLARGQVDSTTFRLDDFVFDPLHAPREIGWTFSALTSVVAEHDPDANSLRISAPSDASAWERLILTASNPEGQSAAHTVDIFVNSGPDLPADLEPFYLPEDSADEFALAVSDPDTPTDLLQVHASSPPHLEVTIQGPPFVARLEPVPDWHGEELVTLVAADNFGFADTTQIRVVVTPVNDAPTFLGAPNVQVTRGKQDSTLVLAEWLHDPDEPAGGLHLTWTGADRVQVEKRSDRLFLSAGDPTWTGVEEILLRVEDEEGLRDSVLLTATVVSSVPPALSAAPQRQGMASGEYFILGLDQLVVDPDDLDADLQWEVSGHHKLYVQLSPSREARIEAPGDFAGTETLTFAVSDPSGESTSFDLLVFAAPATGEPVIAPLPEVSLPLDGVDASLDLDDFVFDLDHDPAQLEWLLPEEGALVLSVDPDSHVLTLTPAAAAEAGLAEVQLAARDPQGNQAVQQLRVNLTGTRPQSFSVDLSDMTFRRDETHRLDLDELVSGHPEPAQIQWQVEGQENVGVDLDPVTHEVALSVPGTWEGSEQLTFVATIGEDLHRKTVQVTVLAPAGGSLTPKLASLPGVTIRAGEFDQSLDLDDFVSDVDPALLTWKVTGDEQTQAVVDEQSHRLIILTGTGWHGDETLQLQGTDGQGLVLEGAVQVKILPPAADLTLREVTAVSLFAGEGQIRLAVADLLQTAADPQVLAWEATASQAVNVTYDPADSVLILEPEHPLEISEIITLRVQDPEEQTATGQILAQVYPADGSVGETSADFRMAIVPNVFQPDYLDVFAISDAALHRAPLLRVRDDAWADMPVTAPGAGIWHSQHVLTPGHEGELSFLALALDAEQQALKAGSALQVGTAESASAKRLSTGDVSIYMPAQSFATDAVVAIIPAAAPDPGPELVPVSPAYRLYSPRSYQAGEGRISMSVPDPAAHVGLYRWELDHWEFAGAERADGLIHAPLPQLGLYAAMDDRTPPQLRFSEEVDGVWRLDWVDRGSGLGAIVVEADRDPLPPAAYQWDGKRLAIDQRMIPSGARWIEVRVADRAGNRAPAVGRPADAAALPDRFVLGQNHPNPFNPSTAIPLFLPAAARVRVEIYNAAGQRVRALLDHDMDAGAQTVSWDGRDDHGRDVSSGLYVYRALSRRQVETRRMTLVR